MEAKRVVDLRGCPRCHGDVHINDDLYGSYRECLQCGYMLDVKQATAKGYKRWRAGGKPGSKRKAA